MVTITNGVMTDKARVVSLLALQSENVQRKFVSSGKFDHSLLVRLTQTMLAVRSFFRLEHEDRDRLRMKMETATDQCAVVQITEDGKLYLNGIFDPKELAKTVIW